MRALIRPALGAGLAFCASGLAAAQTTTLVTWTLEDGQTDVGSLYAEISADGRWITWQSGATNLVHGDTNGARDIFLRDMHQGVTVRVSVASDGTQGDGDSLDPALSLDGRVVAWFSYASTLVPGDTNGKPDVFVHDVLAGTTVRASVSTSGEEADGQSRYPTLSADGRVVAFESSATNLVAGDTNGLRDVFVRDLVTGTTVRASVAADGTQADGESIDSALSPDGRYVAFESTATNLVPGDTNGVSDVFLKDLLTGAIARVSLGSAGEQGDGPSRDPSLCEGPTRVSFSSEATNLVPGDANGYEDIFVRELATGLTQRVNVSTAGTQGHVGAYEGTLSPDGRYVVFFSQASNLTPGDTNSALDVFLRDLVAGTTERVSLGDLGAEGDGDCFYPAVSAGGRYVAFDSVSDELVVADRNGLRDIFVRDRESPFEPFCAGDGSTSTGCPCGDEGLPGHGCESSAASGGATLVASGTTSPDAVRLSAAGLPAGAVAVYLQGDAELPSPAPFGHGLRCVAGSLRRLYTVKAQGEHAAAPAGPYDPPITRRSLVLGDPLGPGATRAYQVAYRDDAHGSCPGGAFNLTNAVRIRW